MTSNQLFDQWFTFNESLLDLIDCVTEGIVPHEEALIRLPYLRGRLTLLNTLRQPLFRDYTYISYRNIKVKACSSFVVLHTMLKKLP
jgi:hypothetical protein